MKNFLGIVLRVVSILAPVPTGWAVVAGLTHRTVWPMPWYIAIPGALALIGVGYFATDLIISTSAFNKSLKRREKGTGIDKVQPVQEARAWALLIGYVIAEVFLSLFIAVFPALTKFCVLVFPALMLSGAFSYSLRQDLQGRQDALDKLRGLAKPKEQVATSKPDKKQGKKKRKPITDAEILQVMTKHQDWGNADLGRYFHVSGEAIRQRKNAIERRKKEFEEAAA